MRGAKFLGIAVVGISVSCASGQLVWVRGHVETWLDEPGVPRVTNSFPAFYSNTNGVPEEFAVSGDLPFINPSARASARPGLLRVMSEAHSRIPTPGPGGGPGTAYRGRWAEARARFSDDITITAAGIANGTLGRASASMRFTGAFATDDYGLGESTFWSASGMLSYALFHPDDQNPGNTTHTSTRYEASYVGESNQFEAGRRWRVTRDYEPKLPDDHPDQGDVLVDMDPLGPGYWVFDDVVNIEFDFVFGESFYIEAGMASLSREMGIHGDAGVGVSMLSDMFNTGAWNGFQSITLEDGTVITDFEALGESGVSYVHAIPAPGSAVALVFGGLFARRRVRA